MGKSSLIRGLCPDPAWFTDQAKVGADAKETIERTSGSWIVELAELDGLGKREANAVKSFVTTTIDRARPAYGRYTVEKSRQFILFGTTNESAFLTDLTGNRRWWVVPVGCCDVEGLSAVRDQLWAEAVHAEPTELLWLGTDALKADAAAVTESVADRGPWFDILADMMPAGPLKIAAADVWRMVGIDAQAINKISPSHRASLRKALAGLGFNPDAKIFGAEESRCTPTFGAIQRLRCGGRLMRAIYTFEIRRKNGRAGAATSSSQSVALCRLW